MPAALPAPAAGPVAIRCPVWGLSFFLPGGAGASPFAGQVSAGRTRLVLFCEILVTGVGLYTIGILLRL